jgi:two-component system alkaline phosphatase synthesis response regulator PhoP
MSSSVPPAVASGLDAQRTGPSLVPGRILVVDDDQVTRTVVASVLQMEDYQVLEAGDGRSGLGTARQVRPELMILDVTMPELDGFAVCQELRADPDLAGMRILILSGRGEPGDGELARRLGADAYLTKPFSSLGLVEVVRQLAGE